MSNLTKDVRQNLDCAETIRSSGSVDVFRIAIVGGGPRALYCLDALSSQLSSHHQLRTIEVVIYGSAETPGAGTVYDLRQPNWLRMNFSNQRIDAWRRDRNKHAEFDEMYRPTLLQWLELNYPALADDAGHAPRAVVGEYLENCFRIVCEQLPLSMSLRIARAWVDEVARSPEGWTVSAAGDISNYDEVLIATGHGGWRSSGVTGDMRKSKSVSYVDHVFPVQTKLSSDAVPAESIVGVCGFALTFTDAALSLTEGRGGKFTPSGHNWIYQPSGDEPKRIFPFSRTGRPMFAKPDESKLRVPDKINVIWEMGRQQILSILRPHGGINFLRSIWPIILQSADRALAVARRDDESSTSQNGRVREWFNKLDVDCDPTAAHRENSKVAEGSSQIGNAESRVYETMKQSYRVATGQVAVDESWALAESWRQLYSSVVKCVSHGNLTEQSWVSFSRIAAEMERVAFGPPAENVGRILGLIETGIIDLSFVRAKIRQDSDGVYLVGDRADQELDVVIDGVIAATGDHGADSVLGKLINAGELCLMCPTTGVSVDASSRAINSDGELVDGLSIIGRATEGCVLGNDTLSRKLHDYPERWASHIASCVSAEIVGRANGGQQ